MVKYQEVVSVQTLQASQIVGIHTSSDLIVRARRGFAYAVSRA
jgi:hypothetical protein